ncbi:MAG: hypothetical protein ACK4HU_21905, partial [Algoriphagus sp.]
MKRYAIRPSFPLRWRQPYFSNQHPAPSLGKCLTFITQGCTLGYATAHKYSQLDPPEIAALIGTA